MIAQSCLGYTAALHHSCTVLYGRPNRWGLTLRQPQDQCCRTPAPTTTGPRTLLQQPSRPITSCTLVDLIPRLQPRLRIDFISTGLLLNLICFTSWLVLTNHSS